MFASCVALRKQHTFSGPCFLLLPSRGPYFTYLTDIEYLILSRGIMSGPS